MIARVLICAVCLLLASCGPDPATTIPSWLTEVNPEDPVLPSECFAREATEPKLPENVDAVPLKDSVADRSALKGAFRYERGKRRACRDRLKELFPNAKKE